MSTEFQATWATYCGIETIQCGIDFIEAHLDDELSLHDVDLAAGLSLWHFQHSFKARTRP